MGDYKRLTNKNLDEYNPEYDFCVGCEHFGEPNGCNRWNGTCGNYERFMETYNRLAELEDKIEQGTLIELPCKVGDTVYFIIKSGNEFVLLEDTCIGFTIADGETHIGLENIPVAVNKYYFTREEAEKRLKELQK